MRSLTLFSLFFLIPAATAGHRRRKTPNQLTQKPLSRKTFFFFSDGPKIINPNPQISIPQILIFEIVDEIGYLDVNKLRISTEKEILSWALKVHKFGFGLSGDKAMIFCFVEFTEPKCALTAMEALQGICDGLKL
ncbi:unnamed protein product [Trifolium pratense]|uniref:Uncharacterized protein n=1 Tax=Trifolium pratense TaxID=57577 RepID=A0ACB0MDB8_TRIPR|nr:unnamed protein product [Trifolium pratense]